MIYLVMQMAIFLVLAAIAGVVAGWWANQLRTASVSEDVVDEQDVSALKRRLDWCFDENAALRRKLKRSEQSLKKLKQQGDDLEDIGSEVTLKEKIQVLMEDLQLRDDTILALEKELELVRNTSS